MDDLISRKAVIGAIVNKVSDIGLHDNSEVARYGATFRQHEIIDIIESLPSAHSEIEERKEESAQNVPKEDLISRKAAIEAMSESLKRVFPEHRQIAEKCLKALPSAQPEPLVKESRTLVKDLVKDTISRQATIDALVKAIRKDPYYDTIMRAERRTDDL